MVSLWIFNLLYDDVFQHGISDLSGCCRCFVIKGSHQAVLDIPCSLGMDLYGRFGCRLGGTIQFWLLWPYVDIAVDWIDRNGSVQTAYMVLILPDGNYDAGYL